jgi:hypothetical protein
MSEQQRNVDSVREYLGELQQRIVDALEQAEGEGRFVAEEWHRPGGGGGRSCILSGGAVFEQAGVGFSHVFGDGMPPSATKARPELAGRKFQAMGVSLVLHPLNPHVPTTHANFRFFSTDEVNDKAVWWFGGGFDLTPFYPNHDDVIHWHREAKRVCDRFGDFQKLDWNDVNPTPQSQDDYNAWFRQNLGRYRPWMERPDTSSPTSSRAATQLAPRGAAWMFLRYTADHHGGGNLKAFLRGVVAGPDIGLRNLLQHSNGAQYDDLLSGWLVSQFTDGVNIPGLPARLSMKSWAVRDLMSGFNNGVFPLQVTPLPASVSTQSISGSGNYFRLTRLTASPETTFRMVSPGGSNVGFAGARVYVVRIS